ncbi:hypothetical protein [Niallia taxi]|uniref:hypothetical protein n=1 Tax=Niallia taxi TaxID=2499688 RepID=UPI0030090805
MIKVNINQDYVEEKFLEELNKRLNKLSHKCTLWDMKELMKQTNMSDNNIKEKFFYDPRFPKYKIGGKWYFPAKEAEEFILMWIKEQVDRY